MKKVASAIVSSAAALLALGFSQGASAQWSFASNGCTGLSNGTYTSCQSSTSSSIAATATGYGSSGSNYVLGKVGWYSGGSLGVTSSGGNESTSSPDHAMDNNNSASGDTNEVLLLNFGASKVALNALAMGYIHSDSDVMVFRWDGIGTTPALNSTVGPTGLAGAGWTLITSADVDGQAGVLGSDTSGSTSFSSAKISSWWLISTYFGSTSGNLNAGDDYFKVLSVSGSVCTSTFTPGGGTGTNNGYTCGNTPSAPEPGSMALTAVALLGAAGIRRRALKAKA